jgi:DNA-binding transcriptional regulator YiaG
MRSQKQQKVLDRLLLSLDQAVRYAHGDKSLGTTRTVYKTQAQPQIDATDLLRQIRGELDMSRSQFAKAFCFNKYSIRNWETGERQPPEYCLAYLKLIASSPIDAYNKLHHTH